ncbi:hypothetical protein BKI52_19875 [marine bacterium AO1-C]|nr:hypothetical protein BKI52_19875 [marine bacterium AO1-C]
MKNIELFIKTLSVVIVITAIPYAFAAYSKSEVKQQKHMKNTKPETVSVSSPNQSLSEKETTRNDSSLIKPKPDHQNTLLGKWQANYPSMKMKAVYEIKKATNGFKGHLIAYIDQQGNRYPENLLALNIQTFSGKQGKGIYHMKYEGKQYQVKCTLTLKNAQTLELNYAYEGYPLKETWKRINQ